MDLSHADGAPGREPGSWALIEALSRNRRFIRHDPRGCGLSSRGLTVRWTSDCLWLTQDGKGQDIVLEAGQYHTCTADSRLVVHALEASRFRANRA